MHFCLDVCVSEYIDIYILYILYILYMYIEYTIVLLYVLGMGKTPRTFSHT